MSDASPDPLSTPTSASTLAIREYRKGNWTLHETLTLITAKRLDDERRAQSRSGGPASAAELRWKWIESYCCANGCLRSQNQCNDKWDNLLRHYKKLTTNQLSHHNPIPYWEMDRQERKDKGLPTNLSAEVFDALADVLSRRSANRPNRRVLIPVPSVTNAQQQQLQVMEKAAAVSAVPTPPPPMSTYQAAPTSPQPSSCVSKLFSPIQTFSAAEMSESSHSEAAEPDRKRRKVGDAGPSVVQGASIIARTLLACEEKREKRQRELIELQERRLRVEAGRAEMDRQGLAGLISAVNSLSNAINASVSHRNRASNGNAR